MQLLCEKVNSMQIKRVCEVIFILLKIFNFQIDPQVLPLCYK